MRKTVFSGSRLFNGGQRELLFSNVPPPTIGNDMFTSAIRQAGRISLVMLDLIAGACWFMLWLLGI